MGGDHEYNLHISGKLSKWNDIILKEGIFEHPDHNIWAGTMRENELTYVNTIRVSEKNGADAYELSEAEIEGQETVEKGDSFPECICAGDGEGAYYQYSEWNWNQGAEKD